MSRTKIAVAAFVAMLFMMDGVVENQGRKVSGVVVHAPSGLEDAGRPISGALVEYQEDGSTEVQTTRTNEKGHFEFPSGRRGIITASSSGLATISVGWPSGSTTLVIELPQPTRLTGRLYDLATRRTIDNDGVVTVFVDHPVNPVSSAASTRGGRYDFKGLAPSPALLVVHALGYAPTYTVVTLEAGEQQQADMGLLLDGRVAGTVVDRSGNAVHSATVYAEYESFEGALFLTRFIGGFTLTNSDGQFDVSGIVPDERFVIYAEHDGERTDSLTLQATPGVPIQGVTLRFD